MRREVLWRAAVVAVFASGLCLDVTRGIGPIGIGPAEAKDYYTKKRVNGRWISGRFPKRSASRASVADKADAEAPAASRAGLATATSRAAAAPGTTPASPQPLEGAAAAMRPTSRQPTTPIPQVQPAQPAASAPLVPHPEGERLDKLRQALQARANALTTASVAPDTRQAPEPQSVSLDFRSGIKTTLFSDGTMVQEPFDVAAMKALAAAPAEAKGAR